MLRLTRLAASELVSCSNWLMRAYIRSLGGAQEANHSVAGAKTRVASANGSSDLTHLVRIYII